LLIVLALGVLLISGGLGYALTPHQLPGLGLSKLNRQFGLWTVTNQSDFQTGVLNNVDVNSSPGDVKIAAPSNWLAGYSYRKSVIVNHADGVYNNTGGTITTYGDYTVHTFTSGGTFTACKAGYVTVLVVGGGGGGGGSDYDCASLGGGGGGGLVYNPSYSVTPGQTYTVVVGAGGAGGSASGNNKGVNGSQSSFGS